MTIVEVGSVTQNSAVAYSEEARHIVDEWKPTGGEGSKGRPVGP